VRRARFLEEAEAEFLREVEHYAKVQLKGAVLFRKAVEAAAVHALNLPRAGVPYLTNTRRVFVRGYPFFLVYREEPDGIAVLAVVHESRRPGYWTSRLR
jgi:plasmid stabilization system protein ParE